LFDDLRDNRIRKNLHLEQERICFGCVESALSVLFKAGNSWKLAGYAGKYYLT
jgi:hypothetical protein